MMNGRAYLLALLLLAAVVSLEAGQPTLITGVITDASGASLQKARVLLIDLTTFDTKKAQVGLDGTFQFRAHPGKYIVIVGGPSDTPCWKAAIRQVAVQDGTTHIRVPLALDMEKCGGVVE